MTPEQIEVAARKLCVTNFYPRFIPEILGKDLS